MNKSHSHQWLGIFALLFVSLFSSCGDDLAENVKQKEITFTINPTTSDNSSLLGSTLTVLAKDADKTITWEETFIVEGNTSIEVPLAERYSFVFSKSGYIAHAQHYLASDLENIDDLYFELIPEESEDFIVHKFFEGKATVYYPADRKKLYTRIDLAEDFRLSYVTIDRSGYDVSGVPVMSSVIVETNQLPLTTLSLNVFENISFDQAPSIRDLVDMETSPLTEDFERDVRIETTLIFTGEDDSFLTFFWDWNFNEDEVREHWCPSVPALCPL